jgi:propanol-preferring alcohol dehydrogenase
MLLTETCDLSKNSEPLILTEMPDPEPGEGEVRIRVSVCAVCHTELDEIEGRTPPPKFPVVPGHQVVGVVDRLGASARLHAVGDRVGIGWIFSACGECESCLVGNENLCDAFRATGRDRHGGYAEYLCAPEEFVVAVPEPLSDEKAAPLFCAGAIGYRSLRLTGLTDGQRLGLTGFGASGHLVLKLVQHEFPLSEVYVFARSERERAFALELGARWAGDTSAQPPELLHAIIDTTPVWKPMIAALECLRPGGRLVVNAIRKESVDQEVLLDLDYPTHLWMEKEIKSVANVTRRDIEAFLQIAADVGMEPEIEVMPLERANEALIGVKRGDIRGARVLSLY